MRSQSACWGLLALIAATLSGALPPLLAQQPIGGGELEPWANGNGVDLGFGMLGSWVRVHRIGQISRWGRREVVIYGQRMVTRCLSLLSRRSATTRSPCFGWMLWR